MYLILYFIFFSFWLYTNYKKFGLNVSSFLICLYLISSTSSIILLYNYDKYDPDRILFIAVIFHIICLFLFLSPIVKLGNIGLKSFDFPKYKYLKYLIYLLIILGLSTVVSSIGNIQQLFSFSEISEARKAYNLREIESGGDGILGYIGGIGNHLSFYTLFFCFYLITYHREKKILIILMFLASLANVFYNLSAVGRDGLVRWILFLIINYLIYKDYLDKKVKRNIKRLSIIPLSVILTIFSLITVSRFSNKGNSFLYSLLEYVGQQNIYFSYGFYQFFEGNFEGKLNFGYFLGERASLNNLNEIIYADYHLNTFSTFIGSFYFDIGVVPTFILCLIFYLVSNSILFFTKINFPKFIIFLIFIEVVTLGLFYFMFYSPTRINSLILLIVISIFISIKSKFYTK